ncbi:MAG: hypothetical protein EBU84_11185 [Actinobacteria bacterium]|nr:hypothetical protein [Actinomycetota bacterium]
MRQPKDFTVPDRSLINEGCSRGILRTISLEEVRDKLKRLHENQRPEDVHKDLRLLEVKFSNGVMSARWTDSERPHRMLLSTNGASQLANAVLPGHFFKGLRQLAQMDKDGEQMAASVWAKFNATKEENVAKVRTTIMKIDGECYKVIRACVSPSYATYSNLEFVQSILENSEGYGQLPVLNWRLTDSGMRIRFLGMEELVYAMANFDESIIKDEPMPMIECWNSEVGRRRVGFRAGLYVHEKHVSFPHWNKMTEFGWIHRGETNRIRQGVRHAFSDLCSSAMEVVEAYKEAKDVGIEHPIEWLENQLKDQMSERRCRAAVKALRESQTTSLASAVDAIAGLAGEEDDLYDQEDVENVASRVLKKGLAIAEKNNGSITGKG